MAVGFPTKANWAAGDVLTASALDDLAGTVNTVQYLKPWNTCLNSNMSVWQRGTSISLAASTNYANGFTADRWQTFTSANEACTIQRVAVGDTTNLPNIQYMLRYQRNAAQTGTTYLPLSQNYESVNAIPFAGKTVTLSFYARAGADFSAVSKALAVYLVSGTGTDQNVYGTYTGLATPISSTATLTTTVQRFTFTGVVPASTTELAIQFSFTPTGTAGTNDYYDITGVQLEQGSVANTYQPNQATYQAELAACERYFQVSAYGIGKAISSTSADVVVLWNNMRVTPSYSILSYSSILLELGTAYRTPTGSSQNSVTSAPLANGFTEIIFTGASGMTTGNMVVIAGNTVIFSAEL